MTDFTMNVDADGVAIITWDVPEKSMNVLRTEAFEELAGTATGPGDDPDDADTALRRIK